MQRAIDRQRRNANPQNFKDDGAGKCGARTRHKSNRQKVNEKKLAELQRYEAAVRKNNHGKTNNHLLSLARTWRHDGVSAKSLQANYGKSVSKKAPGMLMERLKRKAERAGAESNAIDIRDLKTSQYCHTTDDFEKKSLSMRWHVFRDGRGRIQRDLYSAILA